MPASNRRRIPDAAPRAAAIRERAGNVLIDAGAGTGKTTIVVDRVIDLVAPAKAGIAPVPLERLAVLTFTRRAAGELRYRLRQKLLDTLREAGAGARADLLRHALAVVDTAYVGTIHSFADRLLRLYPVEAGISPSYEIAEDAGELVADVFDRLCQAAEAGRLAEALGSHDPGTVPVAEVEETVITAHAAGLRMETREHPWGIWAGLDLLVEGMADSRDVPWLPEPWKPDLKSIRRDARTLGKYLTTVHAPGRGGRYLRAVAARLLELASAASLPAAYRLAHEGLRSPRYRKSVEFENDKVGWEAYKRLWDEAPPALIEPLDRWMGVRIARMRGVVAALYERVKEDHGVVDQLDLLMKLRDLLRDDLEARAGLQSLFDHILVDEFQDTDPLQCEVVFFLAEKGARAGGWRKVRLRPGSLTVVGDPKQSIYRFRRADVRMYAEAHRLLRAQGALPVSLVTNFRSRPAMLRFVNRQFQRLFGAGKDAEPFDAKSGRVRYERLAPDPRIRDAGAAVEIVPYAGPGGAAVNAQGGRDIEAAALVRRVRWLVESGVRVRDPETDVERAARYGDVVVLAHVTSNVGSVLRELEQLGIRYSAHGGTLFLSDPLVHRYILGLRAVADRSDGVAETALLRPPFFGLDLLDVVSRRAGEEVDDERIRAARARLQAARDVLGELRRRRLSRPVLETAVDLIEQTALGKAAATGPNGRQALDTLYQIAYELARRAADGSLDYDGATRLLRGWVNHPIKLDPPEANDPDAIRVMTIHAAKGLEFPIVVLWDGFAEDKARVDGCWTVSRAGDGILIVMDRLTAEVPPTGNLLAIEKEQAQHERERLYYVAMTRARDLLLIPEPAATKPTGKMLPLILEGAVDVVRVRPYRADAEPRWARSRRAAPTAELEADEELGKRTEAAGERFREAMAISGAPVAVPVGVTRLVREVEVAGRGEGEDEVALQEVERVEKAKRSRFGATFGSAVHRAIQLGLSGARGAVEEWVRRAATEYGLVENIEEAVADVERAMAVVRELGGEVMLEAPVVLALSGGRLGVGLIDAVVVRDGEVVVLDYKTDAPPPEAVGLEAYPQYRRQLAAYEEALRTAGVVAERRLERACYSRGAGG